jgi:hypothetical protein
MNVNEYYTLTLVRSIYKFHYGIYTYLECKSQTIYTYNIGFNPQVKFNGRGSTWPQWTGT